jgi:TonB family protein
MAGQILFRVNPVYPPDAKTNHIEGAVVLNAVISTTGTVEKLNVVSGPVELTPSAIDAVRQWKYKPYLLNGMPTEVETTITVSYHLDDSDSDVDAPQPNTTEPSNAGVTPKKIGNGVSAPILISAVEPSYTPEARKAKTSGRVLVNLQVDTDGNPSHVRVLHGIGGGLDEKAIEAVRKYKFKPAMEDDQPVPVQLNLEVEFKIF